MSAQSVLAVFDQHDGTVTLANVEKDHAHSDIGVTFCLIEIGKNGPALG